MTLQEKIDHIKTIDTESVKIYLRKVHIAISLDREQKVALINACENRLRFCDRDLAKVVQTDMNDIGDTDE